MDGRAESRNWRGYAREDSTTLRGQESYAPRPRAVFCARGARRFAVTLQCRFGKAARLSGHNFYKIMKTQNSARNTKGVNNESKNIVNNHVANSTRRVAETRDMWVVIYDYAVSLVVAYSRGNKPEGDPRKGFAFGATTEQPHSRAYAKSLIWGFTTNKAGKVLKDLDVVATKEAREKIAIAILTDCKLVKGDSKAIKASLDKVEPKRERVFAEAVLAELTKAEKKPTTKGGKGGKKSGTKATAPKGSKAEGESKAAAKATTKGGKAKQNTKAAPKGGKAKSATKPAAK